MISKSSAPYIRARSSVPQMMWTAVLALAPVAVSSLFFFGFQAFRVLVVATAAAILGEMAIRGVFRKPPRLDDGSAVVIAVLFALMVPPRLPSWMVALGAAVAVVFGKEIFGGLGQNLFNPALVGRVFLLASFPASLEGQEVLGEPSFLGVLTGGAILLLTRLIRWEVPFLYLGSVWFFSVALGQGGWGALVSGVILLTAFFLVTDPVTTPLTRLGRRWFALGCGLLTVWIRQESAHPEAVTYGVLAMNAVNPWFDRWFRPGRRF